MLGPAIVHTAARDTVAELIRRGYMQVIFGGNAIVAHDVEAAMFGTSLGIDLKTGEPVEHGHRNHLRAINAVRAVGSLEAAHNAGCSAMASSPPRWSMASTWCWLAPSATMARCPASSPIASRRRGACAQAARGVEVAVMAASMLHAIATGNLLPASVRTVAVDINPAVVTKLADRGTRRPWASSPMSSYSCARW